MTIDVIGTAADRSATVLSYEDVVAKNSNFKRTGYIFNGWNTEKDGSGKAYKAGDKVTVPQGTSLLTLYAQYEPDYVTVKFNTNGGTFKDNTIFKNDKVFQLEDNGQVAVLKGQTLAGTKLVDAIKALDSGIKNLPPELTSESMELNALFNAPKDQQMKISKTTGWFVKKNYYAWYTSSKAEKSDIATINGDTALDGNMTYYLGWEYTSGPVEKTIDGKVLGQNLKLINSEKPDADYLVANEKAKLTFDIAINDIAEAILKELPSEGIFPDFSTTFTVTVKAEEGLNLQDVKTENVRITKPEGKYKVKSVEYKNQQLEMTIVNTQYPQTRSAVAEFFDVSLSQTAPIVSTPSLRAMPLKLEAPANEPEKSNNFIGVSIDNLSVENNDIAKIDVTATNVTKGGNNKLKFEPGEGESGILSAEDPIVQKIVQPDLSLNASMYVNEEKNISPVVVKREQAFDVSAELEIGAVKDQLQKIQDLYGTGTAPEDIKISNMETNFVGTMTLPEGLIPRKNLQPTDIKTEGFSNFFEVTGVEVKGQDVIVTMQVADPQSIDTFAKLKDGLNVANKPGGVSNTLKITVPGTTVAKQAKLGTVYNIPGVFNGTFKALSEKTTSHKKLLFDLSWKGDAKTAVKTVDSEINWDFDLPGDILVGNDTEHDAYYSVSKGDKIDYTGRLYIGSVAEQINNLADSYKDESGNDTSGISVKDVQSEFKAVLKLGEGLEVKDGKVVATLDENPLFKVKESNYNPNTREITVVMTLKKDYAKFDDLQNDVNAACRKNPESFLDVVVKGVTVSAASGTQTVTGNVTGFFNGIATSASGTPRYYKFRWKAEQQFDPNGQDYALRNNPDDKTIQFTSIVKDEESGGKDKDKDKDHGRDKDKDKENPIVIEKPNEGKLNIEDHYAYMFGYPDSSFRPEREMTRAEVTAMFARLMKYQPAETKEYTVSYNDINKKDWYFKAVEFMNENGIVKGYPDGSFRPNAYITRAEFATIASRFDKLAETGKTSFPDVASDYWASKYINSAVAKGWVNGYPDGTFKPEKDISRAEVVTVTNHMLYRKADKEFVDSNVDKLINFTDLKDKNYWAYYDIREATNGHDYHRKALYTIDEIWEMLNHKEFKFAVVGRYTEN